MLTVSRILGKTCPLLFCHNKQKSTGAAYFSQNMLSITQQQSNDSGSQGGHGGHGGSGTGQNFLNDFLTR